MLAIASAVALVGVAVAYAWLSGGGEGWVARLWSDENPAPRASVEARATAGQPLALEISSGARLRAPEDAFVPDTRVMIAELSPARHPVSSGRLTPVYAIEADGGPQRPVEIAIPVDRDLARHLGPDDVVIAYWDDGRWHGVPSRFDPEASEVTATVDHFTDFAGFLRSVVDGVVEVAGVGLAKASAAWHDWDPEDAQQRKTPSGFVIQYQIRGPHRVHVGDANANGIPDYIDDVERGLELALRTYDGGGQFALVKIERPLPPIVVRDGGYDANAGDGVMAATTSELIWIDHSLPQRDRAPTLAHELFHYWQISRVGYAAAGRSELWKEATAEWASFAVDATGYFAGPWGIVEQTRPEPVKKGLLAKLSINEKYASGSLALFLESRCPGVSIASFVDPGGVQAGGNVRDILARVLGRRCPRVPLDATIHDYFLAYYAHGGREVGTPLSSDTRQIRGEGYKDRFTATLPPMSAQSIRYQAMVSAVKGTAVVAPRESSMATVTAVTPAGTARDEHPLAGKTFAASDFGPKDTVSWVDVIATNPGAAPVVVDVDFYVLTPPTRPLVAVAKDGKEVRVAWSAAKLKTDRQGGPLAGYRIVDDASGRVVAAVPSESTELRIPIESFTTGETVDARVRAYDVHGNESPDSETASIKRPDPPAERPPVVLGDVPPCKGDACPPPLPGPPSILGFEL